MLMSRHVEDRAVRKSPFHPPLIKIESDGLPNVSQNLVQLAIPVALLQTGKARGGRRPALPSPFIKISTDLQQSYGSPLRHDHLQAVLQ
jgi:hypothetical protein